MSLFFLIVPLAIFAFFVSAIGQQSGFLYSVPWLSAIDVHFSFALNKLSLFMGLLISVIGATITFYATAYMKTMKNQLRFWCFFLSFMVSMIGLVLSENLITLFLFWEGTSICSFFLIGHDHNNPQARKSALNALIITGLGGIFLLTGFIGLGIAGDSYQISTLIENRQEILSSPIIIPSFIFILIGVMTKSAQFPFHFWLPQAMTGPAPVSSFLHSATMVKAGVFLLARLYPLLSQLPFWEITISTIGLTTFVWGGFVAIRNFDIKGILANTTISALGCLVALLGMAKTYPKALEAFFLFFIAHAFYKAALFMCSGIIEKKFKTKDIRQIKMTYNDDILLTIALFIGCFSMMGLPPTIGFIAKETFLDFASNNLYYLIPLMLGGLLNFIAAGKLLYYFFFEKKSPSTVYYAHSTYALSIAPFVLGIGTLLFSFLGNVYLNNFSNTFVQELNGLTTDIHISLWHGFNLPLCLSLVTILLGSLVLSQQKRFKRGIEDDQLSLLSPTQIYEWLLNIIISFADRFTHYYQSGYLRHYFAIIIAAASLQILFTLLYFQPAIVLLNTPIHFTEACLGLIIVFSTFSTLVTESKIWAITQLGIVGTCLILFFIFYGAPDLALTQLLVEIFTLTIFVFALHRLPKMKSYSKPKQRVRDLIIAAIFGGLMGYLNYVSFINQIDKTVASYYAETSYLIAQGRNIVNVILVDYRSFDTMGEISVILMAAIGVFILMRKRSKPNE